MKQPYIVLAALVFTLAVPVIGYLSFGPWTALIFLSGYLVGFLLWLIVPTNVPFTAIKVAYWLTFFLFIVHRVEENRLKFQEELSELTGTPMPEVTSIPLILLLVVSVAAWLLTPFLVQRGYAFGYYLLWTFFASMGVTELAHFIFPFFEPGPYGYFPGMLSVILLAPAAWFGMWQLKSKSTAAA
jgi:hypothetical protein